MGDLAIEKSSSALSVYSSDRCRVYRISGDEFLVIIEDPGQEEPETIIRSVQKKLKAGNVNSELKVSSAVGWVLGSGADILEVVKIADTRMYENKKRSKEVKR